jgi:hypothetical protein
MYAPEDKMYNYSLFLDESGVAELSDKRYQHFLLTGVVVKNSELSILKGYFSLIKRKYNLEEDTPFHTYDLLSNKHSDNHLSEAKAKEFVDSMCEFIELMQLNFWLIHVDKELLRNQYNVSDEDLKGSKENKDKIGLPYYLCALEQLKLFTDLLIEKDKSGEVFADSRTYQDKELLNAFLNIKQSRYFKKDRDNEYYDESRDRLNSITFADKNSLLSGVQLADLVSFIAYKKFTRSLSTSEDMGIPKLWRKIKEKSSEKDFLKIAKTDLSNHLQ